MNCNLFTSPVDRTATQAAYMLRCYPWSAIPKQYKELISWRRMMVVHKYDVLDALDDDMFTYTYKNNKYTIVWAYNNIPTRMEWERKSGDFLITVDLRFSPAIKDMGVAILSFNQ